MSTKDTLIHALTQFDAKELVRTGGSRAKGYNPNALGIYFARVDDICADIANGASPRAAIIAGLTGRVQTVCLKACKLTKATDDERTGRNSPVCYTPAARL